MVHHHHYLFISVIAVAITSTTGGSSEKVSSDDEMEWAYSVNFISSLVFFLIALFTWIRILRKTSSNIVLQTDDNWLNVIEKKNAQHDFEEKGSQDWCSWNRVILCRELASTTGQDPKSVVYPELFRSKDKFDVSKKVYTVSRGANVEVTTEKKEGRSKRQNIVEWKSLELESKEDQRIFRPEVGLSCQNEKQITDAMVDHKTMDKELLKSIMDLCNGSSNLDEKSDKLRTLNALMNEAKGRKMIETEAFHVLSGITEEKRLATNIPKTKKKTMEYSLKYRYAAKRVI